MQTVKQPTGTARVIAGLHIMLQSGTHNVMEIYHLDRLIYVLT